MDIKTKNKQVFGKFYRFPHNSFYSFQFKDLQKVPGFTEKYVQKLLHVSMVYEYIEIIVVRHNSF